MSLQLSEGALVLRFDFGSGVAQVTSSKSTYNNGSWHVAHVHRVERHAILKVNEEDSAEADAPGTMFELSVSDVFYIGGLPPSVRT